MAVSSILNDDNVSLAETPLLNDVASCAVDFKGQPADRSRTGSWKSASFIIVVEVAERFAYFGISFNLISYLTDSLGQSTASAAMNVNAWTGAAALWPLLGAFVADSFLGRYKTITIATVLYILGLGLLTLSAALHSHNFFECKHDSNKPACSPPQLEIVIFFFSLYLVGFAQGGFKPCIQAFGADQFNEDDPGEKKAKSSFFNWWNFSMCSGMLVAFLVLSYIQENLSWELGFGIPCIFMSVALVIFLLGSMTYRFRINIDKRNPFVRIGWVFVKMIKNWQVGPTIMNMYIEEDTEDLEFTLLDKALISSNGLEEQNTCNKGDVDDAKAILRLFPIWSTCLGCALIFSQTPTLFTKQGVTMDRHITSSIQIPAASLQSFTTLSILIFIPIYDRVLVPITRALTKKPTGISMLQRIGTGIFVSCLSMVLAALVERKRLSTASKYGLADKPDITIPMSVLWLVPQYVLHGIFDVFTMVGLQEFFYDQVPKELKSIGLALYLSIFGVGSFMSSFLISVIENATSGEGKYSWFSDNLNRAHLDYFYWLLAGIAAVSLAAFVYFSRAYVYNQKGNF